MEHWKVECDKCKTRWILEYPDGLNGATYSLAQGQKKCKCGANTNLLELMAE